MVWKSVRSVVWTILVLLLSAIVNEILGDDFKISTLFIWAGNYDLAMAYAQDAKIKALAATVGLQNEDNDTLPRNELIESYYKILARISVIHQITDEYDEAIQASEEELIPNLIALSRNKQPPQELGLAYIDLAKSYKGKGEYRKALEFLLKANDAFHDGHTANRHKRKVEEAMNGVNDLIDVASRQDKFVATLVEMAQRWNFARRSFEPKSSRNSASCPPNKHVLRRRDRFHRPSNGICRLAFFVIFCGVVRFAQKKPSRFRKFIVVTAIISWGFLLLVFIPNWVNDSYADKLNMAASWNNWLGRPDRALQVFDEARCAMMENPFDEAIITSETALDTFTGALYIYLELGEDESLVDELASDVRELITSNNVLGPSFSAFGFYVTAAIHYSAKGDAEKSSLYSRLIESESKKLTEAAEEEFRQMLEPKAEADIVNDTGLADNFTYLLEERDIDVPEIEVEYIL